MSWASVKRRVLRWSRIGLPFVAAVLLLVGEGVTRKAEESVRWLNRPKLLPPMEDTLTAAEMRALRPRLSVRDEAKDRIINLWVNRPLLTPGERELLGYEEVNEELSEEVARLREIVEVGMERHRQEWEADWGPRIDLRHLTPAEFLKLEERTRWWSNSRADLVASARIASVSILGVWAALLLPLAVAWGHRYAVRPALVGGIRLWWATKDATVRSVRGIRDYRRRLIEEAKSKSGRSGE